MEKLANKIALSSIIKAAADLTDILERTGEIVGPAADAVGLDDLSDVQKGMAAAALLAAPAVGAAASRRGPGNGALQGTLTAGGALAGYNAGKLASEKLDDTNLDDYLGKPGLQVLKAIAQIGGTAAGGYGGFKAGERLWLG